MKRVRRMVLGAGMLAGVVWLDRALKTRPSPALRVAKKLVPLVMKRKPPESYATRTYPQAAPIPARLREWCDVREREVQGHPVYELMPKQGKTDWHIIYTHGGAYVNALLPNHWEAIAALIRATGASVTVPLYPLAPEHTFQAAYRLLNEVYLDLLNRVPNTNIILCGDSSGGGLALGQALSYRDQGLPLPGRVVLFAPWLDLTLSNPQIQAVQHRDVMLQVDRLRNEGRWWAGEDDPRGMLLSPLYADLKGLPPVDLFQGTDDIFIVDARTFYRRALEAGVDIRLYETPGGFHVFMALTWLPESGEVYRQLAKNLSFRAEQNR